MSDTRSHGSGCISCGSTIGGLTLELGDLPPCNRFSSTPASKIDTWPIRMAECSHCSLIQLVDAPAPEFVVPRVPWIRYNEPDAHLDNVVAELMQLGLAPGANVAGVGPFDLPLLTRCAENNCLALSLDLIGLKASPSGRYPYLETIQERLAPADLKTATQSHGRFDLLACRYLLEHSHLPVEALSAMRGLLAPSGLLLIEVPDCTKFLDQCDYSFVWEEHICYFTEESIKGTLGRAGFDVVKLLRYEGALEDALVLIARPFAQQDSPVRVRSGTSDNTSSRFARYRERFPAQRHAYVSILGERKSKGVATVVFGAGHQAVMFINALRLGQYVSFVIDDDPVKQNHFIPGTSIPIVPTAELNNNSSVGLCLLAVSPRVEGKIMEKCAEFRSRGGEFRSIFSGSGLGTAVN